MPSPSQDTVACTCPSCGNPFAVKTSFLGSQVQCPICAAPVTARQEEKVKDETEEQAAVPCRCNVCNNSFAVNPSCIGNKVKCPVCHSTVTATRQEEEPATAPERMPEAPEKLLKSRKGRLNQQPPSGTAARRRKAPPLPRPHLPTNLLRLRKRRINGALPLPGLPSPSLRNPLPKSASGRKRGTPPLPSQPPAAPPWRMKSRNTSPPPRKPPAASAAPPGTSGSLSPAWCWPRWACSCSCAERTWKRKAPRF